MGSYIPPTPKMVNYLRNLARDHVLPVLGNTAEERVAQVQFGIEQQTLDKFQAMRMIDELKDAPRDVVAGVKPGVYQRNGEIFVARLNREKTRMYAKRLVEIGGTRLNEVDDRVKVDFEYAPGAYQTLRPEDQMTLEEAKPFLIRYSNCMVCGRHLKDATSVEYSIGPVCRGMFAGPKLVVELDPDTSSRLDDMLTQLSRRA